MAVVPNGPYGVDDVGGGQRAAVVMTASLAGRPFLYSKLARNRRHSLIMAGPLAR